MQLDDNVRKLMEIAGELEKIASSLICKEKGNDVYDNQISIQDVRAVLAEKSQDGFTAEVRDLIHKHGGTKLSEVPQGSYEQLIGDAKELCR